MAGSVTGIKAGKAFVLIEAVDATGKVLGQIRNKLGKFGTELSNMGRTMAMRAIAALTPAAFAIKAGTAYDDIMRKVEARSEGTAAEMNVLRAATLTLGRAMGILPSKLGSVQNIFAQAGFNRKEIADIAPAVALLARAGGDAAGTLEDTDMAAKAVSAVLRGFSIDASEAGDVADKLAVALNASNFNLEDITTSLQYAVPAAKFYNVTMEEMLAILGAMRDLQIDASIAGTAFRNMMMYVSQGKERDKFNEDLQKLTGNTVQFTDALGNLKSPLQFLPAMLKATEGLGTAQRSELFSGILQARATIPGAAVGQSVDRMAEMLTRLQNFKGEASRLQKHMDAGLGGAFRRFLATLEETSIKFQTALAPALGTATELIDKLVKCTSDWIITNPGLVSGIVASTVGFLALGTALVVAGQAVISLSALFGLGSMLAGLTSMLITFVAPWAAAAAGIYLAFRAMDQFIAKGEGMWAIQTALQKTAASAKEAGSAFASSFTPMLKEWSETFASVISSLQAGDLEGAFVTLAAQLRVVWRELTNFLMDQWSDFLDFIERSQFQGGMMLLGAKNGYFYNLIKAYSDFLDKYGPQDAASKAGRQKYLESFGDVNKNLTEFQPSDAMNTRKTAKEHRDMMAYEQRFNRSQTIQEVKARQAIAAIDAADAAMLREAENRIRANPLGVAAKKKEMEDAAKALIGPGAVKAIPPKGSVDALDMRSKESWKAFQEAKYGLAENDRALKAAEAAADHLASLDKKITGDGVGVMV